MEMQSLYQEVTKLKTEKAALKVKSKLFENFAAMDESYRSLNRSKQEIEAYSKALDDELEKGKQIQRDFLPDQIPELPGWEIATYFAPAKQVSGDFYDVKTKVFNHIQNAAPSDDITMLAVQRLQQQMRKVIRA